MAHQIFALPKQVNLDSAANTLSGARAYFYLTGTTTPTNVYADADLTTPLSNPVVADSAGVFVPIYMDPAVTYKCVLRTSADVTLYTADPANENVLSSAIIAQTLDSLKRTAAETAAGVTPSNYAYTATPIDVLRYGLVPNQTSARTANTAALQALLDPAVTGPKGRLIFPPITGADTYYFDGIVEVRDGIRMDLMGCTLDFAKTYAAADDLMGFLSFIKDVAIENGAININYDGTGGTNPGMAIRIGSRTGYPFGTYTDGIFDDDDDVEMGNIVLRNLRITSNNPAVAAPVTMIGGLQNVIVENVEINGGGVHTHGIYYEFGFSSKNSSVDTADWSSSHANGLVFRNIRVTNLDDDEVEGAGIGLVGSGPALVENLSVDGAFSILEARPGEAMYYRPWNRDATAAKRCITIRNVSGQNLSSTGLTLQGASDPDASGSGYLNGAGLTDSQKTDLLQFSVDGFAIDADGAGISVSGPCDIRNGVIKGTSSSGGIIVSDECVRFNIDNVQIVDGDTVGIRASFGDNIWTTARKKIGTIRNCHIAGNTGAGIALDDTESVLIENNRLGYNTAYDGTAETTQTAGVSAASDASGVVCRGNHVSVAGGGTAYVSAGAGDRGNSIENARGTRNSSGIWKIDGIALASAAQLADIGDVINTAGKYTYKRVIENSNNRIYFALGSAAADGWRLADGSATVTPA